MRKEISKRGKYWNSLDKNNEASPECVEENPHSIKEDMLNAKWIEWVGRKSGKGWRKGVSEGKTCTENKEVDEQSIIRGADKKEQVKGTKQKRENKELDVIVGKE